jgi:hypothetical protein
MCLISKLNLGLKENIAIVYKAKLKLRMVFTLRDSALCRQCGISLSKLYDRRCKNAE